MGEGSGDNDDWVGIRMLACYMFSELVDETICGSVWNGLIVVMSIWRTCINFESSICLGLFYLIVKTPPGILKNIFALFYLLFKFLGSASIDLNRQVCVSLS